MRQPTAKEYFTGRPCVNGHIAPRRIVNKQCVECAYALTKAWRERNPEKVRASWSRWNAKNRDTTRFYDRLKRGQFYDPTRPMPAGCELCGKPSKRGALHEDHDHATGKFRGWLCMCCNAALGKLGDTREAIVRVLAYLDAAEVTT